MPILLLLFAGALHRPPFPSSQLPLVYMPNSVDFPSKASRLKEILPPIALTEAQQHEYRYFSLS
eukprot:SAG31_NODE_28368_length_411_cov_0.820513_1_plen_63_part_10